METRDELIGQRFSKLVVQEIIYDSRNLKTKICRCKCDCGNTVDTPAYSLLRGYRTSCGCLQKERNKENYIDLIGKTIGSFTVLGRNKESENTRVIMMDCRCKCGKIVPIRLFNLTHPRSKNIMCKDCYRKELSKIKPDEDLTGRKFGMLTVTGPVQYSDEIRRYRNERYWYVTCDCGNKEILSTSQIQTKKLPRCRLCMKHLADYYGTHKVEDHTREILSPFTYIDKKE